MIKHALPKICRVLASPFRNASRVARSLISALFLTVLKNIHAIVVPLTAAEIISTILFNALLRRSQSVRGDLECRCGEQKGKEEISSHLIN